MNIEIGQIYSRKIINFNCDALVINVSKNKLFSNKIYLKILSGGYIGYQFPITETRFKKEFEFNEKLTNEYIIKSIIE